jgi:UPF0755 protein
MKRSCISRLFWTICLSIVVFFIILTATLFLVIPNTAADRFGPASSSLHFVERLYWSVILLTHEEKLTQSQGAMGDEIPFQVEVGESAFSISQRLQELGLVHDPEAFRAYLVYSGLDLRIQAGNFLLSPGMTPIEIALVIQDPTPDFVSFSVLAGWRSEEIAAAIPYSGLEFAPEVLIDIVQAQKAEGYLLPGSYTFPRSIPADEMVATLINAFYDSMTNEMQAGIQAQNFSITEAVILASIIEREAVIEDELPLMASVFLNRLQYGMLLNADPSVQYALGYNPVQDSWWTNPLSSTDLMVDSPYNTYLYPGLPPGPICNPGINAIKAVAFPAQTPYLYFRLSCDGSNRHNFAETLEEHINNACP